LVQAAHTLSGQDADLKYVLIPSELDTLTSPEGCSVLAHESSTEVRIAVPTNIPDKPVDAEPRDGLKFIKRIVEQ
jgi:hypothetical protein